MFFFLPFPPGEAVIGRFTGGDVENQPVLPAFTERFTKEFLSMTNQIAANFKSHN